MEHVENDDKDTALFVAKNLRDLDAVSRYLRKSLEPMLANAINSSLTKWAKDNKWEGEIGWGEYGDIWLAPEKWRVPDTKEFYLRFSLDTDEKGNFLGDGGEDYYWITKILRQGNSRFGISLMCSGQLATPAKFKIWLKDNFSEFRKLGFIYESTGRGFHETYIDFDTFVAAIGSGNLEDTFYPFIEVFDEINTALPKLNKLLEKAKSDLKK